MNLESTAEVIDGMAVSLRDLAEKLDRIAANARSTGDPVYASEAISAVANIVPNLRLDLLVARPLREAVRAESGA